jgi:hypothetical protein
MGNRGSALRNNFIDHSLRRRRHARVCAIADDYREALASEHHRIGLSKALAGPGHNRNTLIF